MCPMRGWLWLSHMVLVRQTLRRVAKVNFSFPFYNVALTHSVTKLKPAKWWVLAEVWFYRVLMRKFLLMDKIWYSWLCVIKNIKQKPTRTYFVLWRGISFKLVPSRIKKNQNHMYLSIPMLRSAPCLCGRRWAEDWPGWGNEGLANSQLKVNHVFHPT